jgi:hypothetical protein
MHTLGLNEHIAEFSLSQDKWVPRIGYGAASPSTALKGCHPSVLQKSAEIHIAGECETIKSIQGVQPRPDSVDAFFTQSQDGH